MSHLVVVGDALLDRDLIGRADRLCPDAPVPVIDEQAIVDRPGGAALASYLAAAPAAGGGTEQVTLVCALADDAGAGTLSSLLAERGVRLLSCRAQGTTIEKIRIRVAGQSLLRLDRGHCHDIGRLPAEALDEIAGADAVLVADYGNGITAHDDVRHAVSTALRAGVPVVWDPHPRGAPPVPGSTIVIPNAAEAELFDGSADGGGSGDHRGDMASAVERARRLRVDWQVTAVAVTLGAQGALLVTGDGVPLMVPVADSVPATQDHCGAGDAFAAAVAGRLAAGGLISEAVEHGVAAASLFVRAGGAGGLSDHGRQPAISDSAVSTPPAPVKADVDAGLVVATGGCFDILHAGHVHTLTNARQLGDRLVVLLNSDDSVRRIKGPGRPLQSEHDRARVLRSLACVDEVVIFDEDTPVEALARLRPAIFVKGGDYSEAALPEVAVMSDWHGTVVTVPFLAGRSTTGILSHVQGGSHAE